MVRNLVIYNLVFLFNLFWNSDVLSQSCSVDSLVLSTSFNHSTMSVYPVDSADGYWHVVSDPDTNTTEPRPAYVISKPTLWLPAFSSSGWISSYNTHATNLNGLYEFEYYFCITDLDNISAYLAIQADDSASVYLNGFKILSTQPTTPGLYAYNDTNIHAVTITNSSYFNVGQNVLKVKLYNVQGDMMGVNISGVIRGEVNAYVSESCCNPNGTISGRKWKDLDKDGVWDTGEPVVYNWNVIATNGVNTQTTSTDVNGYYYFSLPPGTYTISEPAKPGWTQTFPSSGSYIVTLASNQAIVNKNFGNYFDCCSNPTFTVSETAVCADKLVTFSSSCSCDSTVSNWFTWNFGDGSPLDTGCTVTHTYSTPGDYTVTLIEKVIDYCAFDTISDIVSVDTCYPPPCPDCLSSFSPVPGHKYVISAWVKQSLSSSSTLVHTYQGAKIYIEFPGLGAGYTVGPLLGEGQIIDGWQRIEKVFTIPSNATFIKLKLEAVTNDCFFDDIRMFPTDGSMKSYVYDPVSLKLVAELDERNYSTFYEYDEEGKLVRVEKETERGRMTIKETRINVPKR